MKSVKAPASAKTSKSLGNSGVIGKKRSSTVTCNYFTYDHSERLGDAFEYLLSVLGSQGDAGQFRTPRHIIDFMVEVMDPKKNETILDPACGTAGFLISAWKHILKTNTSPGFQVRMAAVGPVICSRPMSAPGWPLASMAMTFRLIWCA